MKEEFMYKIKIDTTTRYEKSVKLLEKEKLLDEVSGDIDVVSSIDGLLKKHNIDITEVEVFEANPGPGPSFTGIKVGVTIANVLNWALGRNKVDELIKPVYGCPPNITPRK